MEVIDLQSLTVDLLHLFEAAQDNPLILSLMLILAPFFGIVGWRILRTAVTMLSWLIVAGMVAVAAIFLATGAM